MPAKGKHRRPKSRSVARGFAVAGTGGAALALPLLGAAGAHAAGAPATAPASTPVQAPQVPAALQAAPAAAVQSAPAVYTVVPGDYLSKIAQDRHLSGGWQQLYADNREAVGTDPSLIHPGLKLTLGAPGEAAAAAQAPAPAEKPAASGAAASFDGKGSAAAAPAAAAPAPAAAAAAAPAKKSTAAKSAAGTVSAAGFVAPVGGGISTQYKTPGAMWSSGYHTGVDFIASSGTTVRAVGAGTVVSAGWAGAYGNEVVIRHADGKYSQYGHLSQLSVSAGQSVTGGQIIGLSGSTGNSTGPHLHFEIRTGPSYGSDIDPLAYLRTKGVSI
ncbi:LysM peptidoglycan-binding domain-containing M23 family metallopeptidase [Streptomyces sp. NPDC057686]|uniref:LysM peptidoglycan-binding domain-containing M23 family metallopeptidase n=1 Tax=Streptomyces sp. NPDC057686 TaxID=3346212 RepID=UPI0036C3C979